jgi:hypothetical protein
MQLTKSGGVCTGELTNPGELVPGKLGISQLLLWFSGSVLLVPRTHHDHLMQLTQSGEVCTGELTNSGEIEPGELGLSNCFCGYLLRAARTLPALVMQSVGCEGRLGWRRNLDMPCYILNRSSVHSN